MYDIYDIGSITNQLRQIDEGPYREHPASNVGSVSSWESFREIPLSTAGDLDRAVSASSTPSDLAVVSYTELDGVSLPVHDTAFDRKHAATINAKYFQQAGFRPGDLVVNCFGSDVTGGGEVFEAGLRTLGAEVIPAGNTDVSTVCRLLTDHDVDGICGPPSTLLELTDTGTSVDTVLGAGEPFTGVPGRRDRVRDRLNAETVVDYFGTRHAQPIAAESRAEDGLYVCSDYVLVEIVDPETEQVLPPGTYGEVVVTHLCKIGTPLFRCRTGDVSRLEVRNGRIALPDSIVGSVTDSITVQGQMISLAGIRNELGALEGTTGEFTVEQAGSEGYRVIYEGETRDEAVRTALAETQPIVPETVTAVPSLADR